MTHCKRQLEPFVPPACAALLKLLRMRSRTLLQLAVADFWMEQKWLCQLLAGQSHGKALEAKRQHVTRIDYSDLMRDREPDLGSAAIRSWDVFVDVDELS